MGSISQTVWPSRTYSELTLRALEPEVRQLLENRFAELDALWEASPYQETLSFAITIKEFMADHQIREVGEGIERFRDFKERQEAVLARLGFGPGTSVMPSRRLASQAA